MDSYQWKNKNETCLLLMNNQMILEEIEKFKFSQISDKRYYFSDEIVSLRFSHPFLKEIVDFKREKKQKIEAFLQQENLFKWKNLQLKKTKEFQFIEVSFNKNQHFVILIR